MSGDTRAVMTAKTIKSDYDLDFVTAETIRARLIETTHHMRNNLVRSAFSNVVRDILDFGVAVHGLGEDSSEIAAITEGCCHFAFTHQHMTNMVLDEWGYDNPGPGGTLFCNDPWRGSIHFPDVNLFRPVFWKDELAFVLTDATHITIIGARRGWLQFHGGHILRRGTSSSTDPHHLRRQTSPFDDQPAPREHPYAVREPRRPPRVVRHVAGRRNPSRRAARAVRHRRGQGRRTVHPRSRREAHAARNRTAAGRGVGRRGVHR